MTSSTALAQDAEQPSPAPPPAVDPALLSEITAFRDDCIRRYKFNNNWDTVLTTVGILLSVAVVAAGFVRRPEVSAILGAVVGAVVTAQRAFPFGQRAGFYRLLIGQSENLTTRAVQRLWTTQQVVDQLSTLRLDFAQELPRGTASLDNHNAPPPPQGIPGADATPLPGVSPQTAGTKSLDPTKPSLPGAGVGDPGAAVGDPGAAVGDPGAAVGDPGAAVGDPGAAGLSNPS